MKAFMMSVVLQRTVLDTMSLKVRASNLEHAYEIARDFSEDYPNNTKQWGKDVPFAIIENRENLSSDVIDIGEDEDVVA